MAASRDEVIEGLAERVGTPPLSAEDIDAILGLAADVAHGTGDRTTAPLASFIAGIAAAGSGDRSATLAGLRRAAVEIAPEQG